MVARNITVFRWFYFFWRFRPLAVLMIIYFSQITSSYAMAMGVFSVFNVSYAFFQVPSGVFSDRIGRRPIILIGSFLLMIAFLILSISGQLGVVWLLYLFAFMWGVGEALVSGSTDALMFETMEELKKANDFRFLYSKSMLSDQLGCAMGAVAAMIVSYYYSIQHVAWITFIPTLGQFVVSLFFVEPRIRLKKNSVSKINVFVALRQFAKNKKLRFYTVMDIFFGSLGDISHRFESAYFKTLTSEWVISLARVLKHFFGMLGFACVSYIKKFQSVKIYFGSIACNVVVRTIAVSCNNIFTPFVHMFINFFYATGATAKADILQHEFLPQYRASAQSLIFFVKGIYMAMLMYLVGLIADVGGILSAMIALIIFRLVGFVLAYIWHKFTLSMV